MKKLSISKKIGYLYTAKTVEQYDFICSKNKKRTKRTDYGYHDGEAQAGKEGIPAGKDAMEDAHAIQGRGDQDHNDGQRIGIRLAVDNHLGVALRNEGRPDPSYHGAVFVDVAGPAAFVTRIRAVILRDTGADLPLSICPKSSPLRSEELRTNGRKGWEYLALLF